MAEHWDAEAVRRLREQLGVTQAELAGRIGTRQQTISEWETGSSTPRRMSQRLLRMVAEEASSYDAGAPEPAPRPPPAEVERSEHSGREERGLPADRPSEGRAPA